MRKRIGIALLLLLLSLLGGGGFYLFSHRPDSDHGPSPVTVSRPSEMPTPELLPAPAGGALATLVRFERSVKSKRADQLVWEQAQEEMPLYGSDSVRTFERSWANISSPRAS